MCLQTKKRLHVQVFVSLGNMSFSACGQVPQHQQKLLVCSTLHLHIQSHSYLGIAKSCRILSQEKKTNQT